MNKEETMKIGNKILHITTEIFIAVMIIVFPLLVDSTGFFRILELKWYSHLTIVSTYIFAILSILIYFFLVKKVNLLKGKKFTKTKFFMIAFLGINAISTFISPYFKTHDLLIGSGRGEGLINILLYTVSFLFVSTFLKFEKRQINYFAVSALVFSTICVTQYFGFNPFNMYQDGIGTHNVSFMGTIGNVDFISAYYTIVLTVSLVTYLFISESKWQSFLNLTAVTMGIFIFQIIDVQSGLVAFMAVAALLAPYILLSGERFSKALVALAGVVVGFFVDLVINLKYVYATKELVFDFQFNELAIGMIICIALLLILAWILKKKDYYLLHQRRRIIIIYGIMILAVIGALVVLYMKDFNIGILHEIYDILHGNFKDEYGTYRVFLWKRAIKLVEEAPVIGTGSDTFAIRFMSKYTQDIAALGKLTINDTAANVYLTILVNTGVVGLIAYVCIVSSVLLKMLKTALVGKLEDKIVHGNTYYYLMAIATFAYAVQDFFNLWVVIVTPIYFVTMAMTENIKNKDNV